MKKSILKLLPVVFALAACSAGNGGNKVITEKFMSNNFTDEISLQGSEAKYEKLDMNISGEPAMEIFQSEGEYFSHLLHLTNDDGKEALYDLALNRFVVEYGEFDSFRAIKYNSLNFIEGVKTVNEKEHVTLIDENGSHLFSDLGTSYSYLGSSYFSRYNRTDKEYMYMVFRANSDEAAPKYVLYNLDQSFKTGEYAEIVEKYGDYLLNERRSLARYGHPELDMIYSTEYVSTYSGAAYVYRAHIFNVKENKFVTSFVIPTTGRAYLAGDYFVYQYATALDERATTYDVYFNNTKYNLTSGRINITNGATETFNSQYLIAYGFDSSRELFDDNYVVKYYYVNDAYLIKSDKTLDPTPYAKIFGDKLNDVADVSGIGFESLRKIGDNYVSNNGLVYNASLVQTAYIKNLTNTDKDRHIFRNDLYNAYGLAAHTGKVLLPAFNQNIQELGNGNYLVETAKEYTLYSIKGEEINGIASLAKEDYVVSVASGTFESLLSAISVKETKQYVWNASTGALELAPTAEAGDVPMLMTGGYKHYGYQILQSLIIKASTNSYYQMRLLAEQTYALNK